MSSIRLASRYAKSLIGLAIEQGNLEDVKKDISKLSVQCKDSRELKVFLSNPIINADKKKSVAKELWGTEFNILTAEFIYIIIKKRREYYLPEIVEQFLHFYREHKNVKLVDVTTAFKIDEGLKAHFSSLMKKNSDSTIEIRNFVDQDIIGGFILKYDNKQYDASIHGKLENFKKEFSKNLYVKDY